MTTVEKIILDARALLDEYTEDGVLIPEDEIIDIQSKGIRFADMAQKELFRTGNLYKTFKINRKPYVNLIQNPYEIMDSLGVDWYSNECIMGNSSTKAYYFEADAPCTVIVEEKELGSWQTLVTITPNPTTMTAYKGILTPTTSTNVLRYRFVGGYFYQHQNRCIWDIPFRPTAIPDFKAWVPYEMPSDFRMVDCIVEEYPTAQYSKDANYKWEGFKTLFVDYGFQGEIRVIYKPIPTTLTALTDVLEIDDITANAITYYVASKLATSENQDLVNYYEARFNELKAESYVKMPASEQQITDVYKGEW